MKEKEIKVRPFFVKCMIVQSITVILMLLTVVIIKFSAPELFIKIQKWYENNLLDETSVSEVSEKAEKFEI